MKIYVDESPKDCIECPCETEYYCNLLNEDVGYLKWGEIHKDCPLQSIADHDKQVRKEVCEEIKQKIKTLIESKDFKLCNHEYANGYCYGLQYDLAKIIDQIQGEIK